MVRKRRVTFLAGVKTKTKKDDRVVDFFAAPKGTMDGIKVDIGMKKEKGSGISGFDKAFGLGGFNFGKGLNPELSSPFASTETKVTKTEIGFGRSFFEEDQQFLDNDPVAPEAISENFKDPKEEDLFDIEDESMIGVDFGVPNLFESVQEISLGKRTPKADRQFRRGTERAEDPSITANEFEDTRFKQLTGGAAPLSEQEAQNFQRGRTFSGGVVV